MTEKTVFGACPHDCPDTCSMLTTVKDGKAIEVRGNPDHPFTQGGLCVKVNPYLDHVAAPDRLMTPLRRIGPKGAGRFEPVSWDDALDLVARVTVAVIDEQGEDGLFWSCFDPARVS